MQFNIYIATISILLFLYTPAISCQRGLCLSQIYCQGSLLERIQKSGIFEDSKTFVDMPTIKPEAEVLINFSKLSLDATSAELREFLQENFAIAGSDLDTPHPIDWNSDISLLRNINDTGVREWALEIHKIWKTLIRQFNTSKLCDGCATSSLPLKYPFIIPGGRFREFYYWDTYWILEGLLISEMYETAKGVLLNLLDIIEKNGFIPNGARIYYLGRSQPPYITQMMKRYYIRTNDIEILRKHINLLDEEYFFWMHNRSVGLNITSEHSISHTIPAKYDLSSFFSTPSSQDILNVYRVESYHPRPESYMEDLILGESLSSDAEKTDFYQNIASAAESGWDFSSRWMNSDFVSGIHDSPEESIPNFFSPYGLSKMDIIHLIPLDLNALMYANERTLEWFHYILNNNTYDTMAQFYHLSANRRYTTMKKVLWDEHNQVWSDFNLTSSRLQSQLLNDDHCKSQNSTLNKGYRKSGRYYVSDFSTLWYLGDCWNGNSALDIPHDISCDMDETFRLTTKNLLNILFPQNDSGLNSIWDYPGGVPTSGITSRQQWDFPNAWAPFQYYIVDFLVNQSKKTDNDKSKTYYQWALQIATRWVHSTYCGWNRTRLLYEKYNVMYSGIPGEGGEYTVQEGFGWTNAVILMLLEKFPNEIYLPTTCISPEPKATSPLDMK